MPSPAAGGSSSRQRAAKDVVDVLNEMSMLLVGRPPQRTEDQLEAKIETTAHRLG